MWTDQKNLADPEEVAKVLDAAGLPTLELLRLSAEPEIKQALIATTEQAVQRGIFGAPTLFIGEEMFFGQDRLDFIEERLIEEARGAAD
jgi:2-hydroxychromene-2-carboxylate isomerase